MEQSTAREVRDLVLHSTDRFWRIEDLPGAPHAVTMELARLVKAGQLQRVRRGVYWRGHESRFGMVGAPAVSAVRQVVGEREAVGAAGWYATNLLGLSTQVSPVPVVAVTQRPPTGFSAIRVVDRSRRTGRRDQQLNDTEVTVLEALESWDRHIELDNQTALDRFVEILRRDEVRVDRLALAAETESSRVRERLRTVLMQGGWIHEAQKVSPARSASSRARAQQVLPIGHD